MGILSYRNVVIVITIVLLIGASIAQAIIEFDREYLKKNIIDFSKNDIMQNNVSVSFYVFGKEEIMKNDVVLTSDDTNRIYQLFKEMNYETSYLHLQTW